MLNFIANWHRERETVRELSRLSDRELADLGIARADIRAIAGGAQTMTRHDDIAGPVSLAALRDADTLAPSWAAHNRRSLAA